jgi:hypothetical protein
VTESWIAATRILLQADGVPVVTVLLDSEPPQIEELLREGRVAQGAGYPIEIRASVLGPSRGTGHVAAEIAVIVQQAGLGAVGSGIWAAVETVLRRVLSGQAKRDEPSRTAAELPGGTVPSRTLTVLLATEEGPALVHSESIGGAAADLADLNVERIVAMLLARTDLPPQG